MADDVFDDQEHGDLSALDFDLGSWEDLEEERDYIMEPGEKGFVLEGWEASFSQKSNHAMINFKFRSVGNDNARDNDKVMFRNVMIAGPARTTPFGIVDFCRALPRDGNGSPQRFEGTAAEKVELLNAWMGLEMRATVKQSPRQDAEGNAVLKADGTPEMRAEIDRFIVHA